MKRNPEAPLSEIEINRKKIRRQANNARYYRRNREVVSVLDQHLARNGSGSEVLEESTISEEELLAIEEEGMFVSVSDGKKKSIYETAGRKLDASSVVRSVCGICDCSWPQEAIQRQRFGGKRAGTWRRRLCAHPDVPESLKAFYDISECLTEGTGALLSRKGVELNAEGQATGYVRVFLMAVKPVCHLRVINLRSSQLQMGLTLDSSHQNCKIPHT